MSKNNSQMIESEEYRYRSLSDQRRNKKISVKRPSHYSIAVATPGPFSNQYSIGPNGDKVFENQDKL